MEHAACQNFGQLTPADILIFVVDIVNGQALQWGCQAQSRADCERPLQGRRAQHLHLVLPMRSPDRLSEHML